MCCRTVHVHSRITRTQREDVFPLLFLAPTLSLSLFFPSGPDRKSEYRSSSDLSVWIESLQPSYDIAWLRLARVEVLGLVQDDHVVLCHVLHLACMYGSRRWRRRRPLRFSSLASREPVDSSPALPLIWHAMCPSVWATVFFNQASTLAAEVWT